MTFNFFEPFLNQKNTKTNWENVFIVALVLCILSGAGFYYELLIVEIDAVNNELQVLRASLESTGVLEQVKIVNELEEKQSELSDIYSELEILEEKSHENRSFDDQQMDFINAQVPSGLFIDAMQITPDFIEIKGYSERYSAITRFVSNLRSSGNFFALNIISINEDNDFHDFNIKIEIVEGGLNEN